MPIKRDPETGNFSDKRLGVMIFFGIVVFIIFFMIGSVDTEFMPFAFIFFGAYAVGNILGSYAFNAKIIAQNGKLSEGVVTEIVAKPKSFSDMGRKTIKIRFEFYAERTVKGETAWLTFSELDCPYFVGKEIRVAHTGLAKAVIIKRIYDLNGKLYYSVYENSPNETGELSADKNIGRESDAADKYTDKNIGQRSETTGVYTDKNSGQGSGEAGKKTDAAKGVYTDKNSGQSGAMGRKTDAVRGIYTNWDMNVQRSDAGWETIGQRVEAVGKKIDAAKDGTGGGDVQVVEYDAFEKKYTAALPVLMKEHEEHRAADAKLREAEKNGLTEDDGKEKICSVPFETVSGSAENRGTEPRIKDAKGVELSAFEAYKNRGTEPLITADSYYGAELKTTAENYGAEPRMAADKKDGTTAFRLSEIKDKYTAVEILSEVVGASKYDVRTKIETGNAVFEIPIERVSEVAERLDGIAVLIEN
jgi:hypothetical protein